MKLAGIDQGDLLFFQSLLQVLQGTIELPVLSGSTGPDVIDIRKLYAGTGAFTFDPGFTLGARGTLEQKTVKVAGFLRVFLSHFI